MGLYEKIYNVMAESSALEKDMSVGGQYKAISEKMVLNEIKPLLKKHKLILIPVAAEVEQKEKLTVISAKYKIIDIETGESEILATIGNGADSQDKGSGKAWTYAYKCLIQKTFCLFSGEDTDNEHSDDITAKQTKAKGEYKSASTGEPKQVGHKLVSDKQLALLYAKGKGKEDKVKEIITKYGFSSSKEIVTSVFNAILAEVDQL